MKAKQNSKPLSFLIIICFIFTSIDALAQVDTYFTKEVTNLVTKTDSLYNPSLNTIVFTGSSSVRMWKNLQESFPEQQILNTGFGGSQASDLLYYLDNLVLNYKPSKVFIYEGDNDIWALKKTKDIIHTLKEIISQIHLKYPATQTFLISAKPSISRWKMRRKYKRLNKK